MLECATDSTNRSRPNHGRFAGGVAEQHRGCVLGCERPGLAGVFTRRGPPGRCRKVAGSALSTLADRAVTAPSDPAEAPLRPVPISDLVVRRRPAAVLRAYVALTKPRIVELLLVTTVPAIVLAHRRFPGPGWIFGALGVP